jgi:hypothetical protein
LHLEHSETYSESSLVVFSLNPAHLEHLECGWQPLSPGAVPKEERLTKS